MDNQIEHQKQLIYETITEKAFEDNLDECNRKFEELCNIYRNGFITKREIREKFTGVFINGFESFIYNNNLKLIRPSVQNRWERFDEDYHLWKNGQHSCSNKGDLWITYLRDSSGCVHVGDEASYIDKKRFFSLMEAFGVPIDYYKPAPKNTAFSNQRYSRMSPFRISVGFGDYWQDDDGLLLEDCLLGSIVTLTDRYGLKSRIKITEHLTPEEKRERRLYADYVGIGYIEGYTTSRDRIIEISLYNGKISSLYTEIDIDDKNAFSSFPLWQTEFQYYREINKVTWDVVDNLIKKFLGDLYESSKLCEDEYPGYIIYR